MNDRGQFRTSDIAFAAYLLVKGLRLIEAGRSAENHGRHYYIFEDPEQIAPSLSLEFTNSPEASFDAAIRKLKKIVYG